jgi:enterochelin esterase-like enzyme
VGAIVQGLALDLPTPSIMSVSPASAPSRAHVWFEGLGDWSWPGARPAPEPLPPPWVPQRPPRLALAVPAGYAGHPPTPARRVSPRAIAVWLLALVAAVFTGALAFVGPGGLEKRLGGASHPSAAKAGVAAARPAPDAASLASVSLLEVAPSGSTIASVRFPSAALHEHASFLVYLPPAFSYGGRRYPVLYLLHGKAQRASSFLELGLAETLDRLIARHTIKPMIAVMLRGGPGHNDWRDHRARGYESYVLEAQQVVDRLYPTIPLRGARAIAGASLGGFGAMNVALTHPDRFGTVESWLGFFDGLAGELRAARPVIARDGLHAFLYGASSDTIADPAENASFAAALRAAGASAKDAVFPGAHTMETLERHLALMLKFAGRSLALASAPHASVAHAR